jgi:HD-GYP domain-containing protein (c-di-GMP phosphodiesterase class II)
MSEPEPTPPAPGTARVRAPQEGSPVTAADQRLREAGLAILTRFSAAVRMGRSYSVENQVVANQLESLREVLVPVLEEHGEAVLVALEDDMFLNGARIPIRNNSLKFHRITLEEFRRRQIAGVRAVKGMRNEELATFFRLFVQPDLYAGPELLAGCLAQGNDHVLPVIHASTEAPDEEDFGWGIFDRARSSGPRPEDPAPGGGLSGGGGGGGGTGGGEGSGEGGGFGGSGGGIGDGGGGPGTGRAPRGSARKAYASAVQGARSLLTTTSLHGGMELRHAKRVVQPLVDGAFASDPVVVGLSSLSHHDEYTYAHAVNVCLVAVTMGHYLELDRRALSDLGVAALLHDVGKSVVADLIHHSSEHFTPEEEAAAHRHPLEGAKLLAGSTTLNQTTLRCMRVALEHHMAADQSGYPKPASRWSPSVLSRLVAAADCYVSLQTHRSRRGGEITPYQALGMMMGPLKKRFDPVMLWALVNTVGIYPPGQMVEMDDGSIAIVLAPNAADLVRPHVRIVVAATGERLEAERRQELSPIPADRSVKRPLPASEYPADPDKERAA